MFALLATWLLASNHCYLEAVGAVGPDQCDKTEKSSSPQSDPCENGCKVVEKAGHKTQDIAQVPAFVAILLLDFQPELETATAPGESKAITAWPPETLSLPQFLTRTSLPVRAPSFIS